MTTFPSSITTKTINFIKWHRAAAVESTHALEYHQFGAKVPLGVSGMPGLSPAVSPTLECSAEAENSADEARRTF